MFRLTNKGNQSRKNHKIINQTTKISDTDAKLSQTAIQAQQLAETKAENAAPAQPAAGSMQNAEIIPSVLPPPEGVKVGIDDIETYIRKMNEYLAHMKILENRNATLERENNRFKAENDHLRERMDHMSHSNVAHRTDIKLKPGAISQQVAKEFF